jgi:hypothetical protein
MYYLLCRIWHFCKLFVIDCVGIGTYCVVVEKIVFRVNNMIKTNHYDIVKADWLIRCLDAKSLIPWYVLTCSPHFTGICLFKHFVCLNTVLNSQILNYQFNFAISNEYYYCSILFLSPCTCGIELALYLEGLAVLQKTILAVALDAFNWASIFRGNTKV